MTIATYKYKKSPNILAIFQVLIYYRYALEVLIMQRVLPAVFLNIVLMLSLTSACTRSGDQSALLAISSTPKSQPKGPILARAGHYELKLSEVDDLAAMASKVRQGPPWNLPPPPMETFEQRMQLAIELLAMASAAEDGAIDKKLLQDSMSRSLASAYLRRAFLSESQRPVTEKQLHKAQMEEIRKYITTGESELYRPTRVDFTIIGVGINPSWVKYEKDTVVNIMSVQQTMELAAKIKKLAGDHLSDLDKFESLARKFEKHNPTVRIIHQKRAALPDGLFPMSTIIRSQLIKLRDNGDISPVIETPAGAMILRRGVTWPGKGEDAEEIKDRLSRKVREKRSMQHLKKITEALSKKYAIKTWPEAIDSLQKTEIRK